MKRRLFFKVLLATCWLPLLLAAAAVSIEVVGITGAKTGYVALGKLVITYPLEALKHQVDAGAAEFVGTQIEILESGELRRRALERVRGLHPELKEAEVDIRVSRIKGSLILKITASGDEQKYTRVYLDALLDEYMAFRQEMIEKSIGSAMNKVIEEVLAREKQVREDDRLLTSFRHDQDPLLLTVEHERLVKAVSTQRGELEALERAKAAEDQLKTARQDLADAEKRLAESNQARSALEQLEKTSASHRADYLQWKKTLENLDSALKNSDAPGVAIMERPAAAIMAAPDLVRKVVVAALVGVGAGLILMLVGAIFVSSAYGGSGPPPVPG